MMPLLQPLRRPPLTEEEFYDLGTDRRYRVRRALGGLWARLTGLRAVLRHHRTKPRIS